MVLKNGCVLMPDGRFQQADIQFERGIITNIADAGSITGDKARDIDGLYVLPGLIDIHTHGAAGYDFCDASTQGLEAMLEYYGSQGITSVIPTTMSFPEETLAGIIRYALPYMHKENQGAVFRGIHMEGPYINKNKCGAQNPAYIYPPNIDAFMELQAIAKGCIRIVDVAPELEGAMEFVQQARKVCTVSLAHTEADYDVAATAFENGASQVTHLFNAMPPFLSREPGVVGAAYEQAKFVEMISDGLHLHKAAVQATFSMFGSHRICLVSDSVRATGMPNGSYDLGGQQIIVKDGKAVLAQNPNAIAGSVVPLPDMCRRAVAFGVPLAVAVQAASINPAKAVGIDDIVGSIETGKRADFVLWNQQLETVDVLSAGNSIL